MLPYRLCGSEMDPEERFGGGGVQDLFIKSKGEHISSSASISVESVKSHRDELQL